MSQIDSARNSCKELAALQEVDITAHYPETFAVTAAAGKNAQ